MTTFAKNEFEKAKDLAGNLQKFKFTENRKVKKQIKEMTDFSKKNFAFKLEK